MVGVKVGGLLSLPPQHPQNLLFQHGVHLHASLQLFQLLRVLAYVEALDLLVGALDLLQRSLARKTWAPRARVCCQAIAFQVESQAAQVDVVVMAVGAFVWTLAGMKAFVQLQVDELRELSWAEFAVIRLFPRVKAQVSFQVAGAAEALVTHL